MQSYLDIVHIFIFRERSRSLSTDKDNTLDEVVIDLRNFLEDAVKTQCSYMRDAVLNFIDKSKVNNQKSGRKFCSENSVVQICIVLEIMKMVNKTLFLISQALAEVLVGKISTSTSVLLQYMMTLS